MDSPPGGGGAYPKTPSRRGVDVGRVRDEGPMNGPPGHAMRRRRVRERGRVLSVGAAVGLAGFLAAAPSVCPEEGWVRGRGFELRNRGQDARIRLEAYGQLDFQSLLNWHDQTAESKVADDDVDLARLRAGLQGEWRRVSFEAQADFVDEDHLKDLWLGFRATKALRLRVGHQKVPVSGEWLTSPRRIDFARRALPVESLAPGRDWGVVLHGEIAPRVEYQVGVFAGDGRGSVARAQTTTAAHLLLEPVRSLRLGGSFSIAQVAAAAVSEGDAGKPRGLEGDAHSGFEYFSRKFVDGRRRRLGGEASFTRGPVRLSGEYLEDRDQRQGQGPDYGDLPAVEGRGFSVVGSWLVTGEAKKGAVKPRRPLPRGPGAVEVALRYDTLHFDDDGPDSGFAGVGDRSRNLVPLGDRALTAGLSWWPVSGVRLLANVMVERFDDRRLAPEPGRSGDYVTFLGRLQLELP